MLRELPPGALAARRPFRAHPLAGLDDLLEPAQVVVELLVRVLAEIPRHLLAEPAARHPVAQLHADLGAPAAGRGHEAHLALVADVRAVQGPPRDPLAGHVTGDARVPLDGPAERGAGPPVAGGLAGRTDLVQVGHEGGQALQLPPPVVRLLRRAV